MTVLGKFSIDVLVGLLHLQALFLSPFPATVTEHPKRTLRDCSRALSDVR